MSQPISVQDIVIANILYFNILSLNCEGEVM